MREISWDLPKTEEGLQQALTQLEVSRAQEDYVQIGNGLLSLCFLVKWVRSDTDLASFERSHQLALEAVEVFRKADDKKGLVRALISASAMATPQRREELLLESEQIAESSTDKNIFASVLSARARALAMSDRERAAGLHRQALDIYRGTGNKKGQAACLFSLSISSGSSSEKLAIALEAAQIYRELKDPENASRCVSIAFMNAEEIQPLVELEELARLGLQDAWDAGDRSQEGQFYKKLAKIMVAEGDVNEAAKYQRFAADIRDSDGMTPRERWEQDVAMSKMMITTSKTQGNKVGEKMFTEELRRLKANKPKK